MIEGEGKPTFSKQSDALGGGKGGGGGLARDKDALWPCYCVPN